LDSRKIDKDTLYNLLEKRLEGDKFRTLNNLPNPSSFKDIQKATKRVVDAISQNEPITIVVIMM
jgi:single-stranded-DNA-specific exonuclease